jgi:valyl-tRNA synthetase
MENIRDWCISRQLWWGHRIPAWTCEECGNLVVANETPKKCDKCGGTKLTQEEDVLDTWFSSALWPFSTLGWPEQTEELARYYPTSLLITGFDIIFFWVSRMIMMGLEFMGDVPFRDVYIHALVRDEQGQKMSKSKGNVIDPLDIIEQYGADSLRFTLAALTTQGRDIFLSASRIETYRFFLNKLWNASRFALMNLENEFPSSEKPDRLFLEKFTEFRFHDRWILSRTREMITSTTQHFDGYFFGEAARGLYEFVWGELCDWYLEMAKPALRGEEGAERKRATQEVLREVFFVTLQLLHPIIPFVTEELWHAFGFGESSIEESHWPKPERIPLHFDKDDDMGFFQDVVKNIRNLRAEARLSPQTMTPRVILVVPEEKDRRFLASCEDLVRLLARVETLSILDEAANLPRSLSAVLPRAVIHLEVSELLDVDAEIARLTQELQKLDKDMAMSERKLSDESFLRRAPQDVVEKERTRLAESKNRKRRILENLESLR